jgi:ATP-dependent helicase HrpB
MKELSGLPVQVVIPAVQDALRRGTNAVLVAPPGAGKTTSVPLALLGEPWAEGKGLIMLAPRRLAARAAAHRMASLLGERVGETVGYTVRLDRKVSARTRIEVVTEGVFTRRILADPELTDIAAVIFDEVHERNLEGDLGLALALDAQMGLREDLRLLAMSATVDGARVSGLLRHAPVLESAGRMFPVETIYLGRQPHTAIDVQAYEACVRALRETEGDMLVFLPGAAEIARTARRLEDALPDRPIDVYPLHGSLDPRAQDVAIAPSVAGRRKIVLATSIAETSLTIAGVSVVIDCGLSRRNAYSPDTGLSTLVTVRASLASADQRRGRAGRTGPGVCYRLWHEAEMGALPAFDRPEILEADLAPLVLNLAAWGVSDAVALAWLDPPPKPAWQEAVRLLETLGALDAAGRLTDHGRALSHFGLPPRLAHMIVAATEMGFGMTAAYVAAILSERGLGGPGLDVSQRVAALLNERGDKASKARQQAIGWAASQGASEAVAPHMCGLALALAFPERVAKARGAKGQFVMVGGRGGAVSLDERLSGAAFLAVGSLTGSGANARILEAAEITLEDIETLFGDQITQTRQVSYDAATGGVRGRMMRALGALVLAEAPIGLTQDQISSGLLEAVKNRGLDLLPWDDKARRLRGRMAWLHARLGDPWPDVSDLALMERLEDWLAPGLEQVKMIRQVDVAEALLSLLDWQARRQLETEAPERFATPAQTTHAIDYECEQGPTVSLRSQEVYGLTVHPHLAQGRVPLVFELLSPAYRPIALTQDLPGFWKGAWGDVRKDMKARYPKHVWPDDPSSAAPTTRAKPRGT